VCFKSVIQSGRSLFLSKIKKNTLLKLPVDVSPLQLVNLHRNRRYFVIKLHTLMTLSNRTCVWYWLRSDHLSSPPVFSEVRAAQSLVFVKCFVDHSCFFLLFGSLYCWLFFAFEAFDYQLCSYKLFLSELTANVHCQINTIYVTQWLAWKTDTLSDLKTGSQKYTWI
jgi:hypothetical protein